MGVKILKKNTMVERFTDPDDEGLQKVTMQQLETLYLTSVVYEDGTVVNAKMPYLICLALNGNLTAVMKLLRKYPLMRSDGWSNALDIKLKTEGTYLTMRHKNGDVNRRVGILSDKVSIILALGISRRIQSQKMFNTYYGWNGIAYTDIARINNTYLSNEMRDHLNGAIEEAEFYLDLKAILEKKTEGEA